MAASFTTYDTYRYAAMADSALKSYTKLNKNYQGPEFNAQKFAGEFFCGNGAPIVGCATVGAVTGAVIGSQCGGSIVGGTIGGAVVGSLVGIAIIKCKMSSEKHSSF